jgi:hypothetical protein
VGNHRTALTEEEANSTAKMDKAADFRWGVLSTEKRLQLGGLAERLTAVFNRVLALQTLAQRRSVRRHHGCPPCSGAATCPKKPQWTRLLLVDLQAVKNTCNASIETKGFCHYKCTNGIKRHLAVDTLGLPFFTHCTKANATDDQGLIEMLIDHIDYFRKKPVYIPKITILLDHGYHPDTITTALQLFYPQILTKIRFQLAPKPTKAQKVAAGKMGFVPIATRWIIERSKA